MLHKELEKAVLLGDTSLTKALLANECDIDAKDKYGRTLLYDAIVKGFTDIVEELCLARINVNHQDNNGKTPLHFASIHNKLDIAIVRPPEQYPKVITIRNLIHEKLIVALPIQYPSNDDVIDLAELKNESLIVSPAEVSAGLYAAILNTCNAHGFIPQIGQQAPQIVSMLSLVAANLGISLVPESTQQLKIEGVKYKYLKNETATIALGIAFKEGLDCQPAINFLSLMNTVVRQGQHLNDDVT